MAKKTKKKESDLTRENKRFPKNAKANEEPVKMIRKSIETIKFARGQVEQSLRHLHEIMSTLNETLLIYQLEIFTKKSPKGYFVPIKFEVLSARREKGHAYISCSVIYYYIRHGMILYDLNDYLINLKKVGLVDEIFLSHDVKVVLAEKGMPLPLPHAYINNNFIIESII